MSAKADRDEIERLTRERDRLHGDALGALAKAGICTPEEGYLKAPHCLASNIAELARERAEARACRKALSDHGWHKTDCPAFPPGGDEADCDCGWSAAVETADEIERKTRKP